MGIRLATCERFIHCNALCNALPLFDPETTSGTVIAFQIPAFQTYRLGRPFRYRVSNSCLPCPDKSEKLTLSTSGKDRIHPELLSTMKCACE